MKNTPSLNGQMADLSDAVEDFKGRYNSRVDDMEQRIGEMEADRSASKFEHRGSGFNLPRDFNEQLRELAKGNIGSINMAITVGNESAEVLTGIDTVARRTSPIMGLVRNINSPTGNLAHITAGTQMASGWVGEAGTRSETATSAFNKIDLAGAFCYARPKISEEALMDSSFDLGPWIVEEAGRAIGQTIGAAIVNGTGSSQPTGFLNGNTVSPLTIVSTTDTASPVRPFGSIQYLPTGAAASFQQDRLGSPMGDPAGVLFNALFALNPEYRGSSTWVCNSTTLAAVRKMRDADGNYLYTAGLKEGEEGLLLGRPVLVAEDMPDIAANACIMAIADWQRAYALVNVGELRITIDNNITTPGQVLYYIRARKLGGIIDDSGIKVVKCSVS